jgi:hypothetical protein
MNDVGEGNPVADLHVHTTVSDGTLRIEEVPDAARAAGLEWVALTDHDRYHPALDAPTVAREGVTLVCGIELRVDAGDQRLDLLGYGLEPTAALDAVIERIQRDRVERAATMIDRLEERLDVTLDVEPRRGIGRPHVARAIAASDVDYDYQGAFDELIGDGRPCYVARDVPDFERGREVLADACAVVGLAHPLRYPDPAAALDVAATLDAVERYYPYDDPADPGIVDRAIEDHDLLATGGSDAHDRTLGVSGPPREAFDRFRRALVR